MPMIRETLAAVLEQSGLAPPYGKSQPLKIRKLALDAPGPGEVLVRIGAAGLCHSDLSVVSGNRPRPLPMALGHEAAGEVVECGAGVRDLAPGDRVVMVFVPSCGDCLCCMEGKPALCTTGASANTAGTLLSGERRLRDRDRPVHHHVGVSCFAEYAVVSRRSCVKIRWDRNELSDWEAALFGCAVLTGAGAVINTLRVEAGSSVAVVGLGGVGFSALLAAVAAGARQVVAIDLNPAKLALAKELGATDVVDGKDTDAAEIVKKASGGGVDYAIDAAGAVNALELAWHITRRGGTTVSAGLPHPTSRFHLPASQMVAEERVLRGSYMGSSVPARDILRYIELYLRGKLPVNRLLGRHIGLHDINDALDRLATGESLRDIIVFDRVAQAAV